MAMLSLTKHQASHVGQQSLGFNWNLVSITILLLEFINDIVHCFVAEYSEKSAMNSLKSIDFVNSL